MCLLYTVEAGFFVVVKSVSDNKKRIRIQQQETDPDPTLHLQSWNDKMCLAN